jgi:WD40 repeat protein
VRTLAPVVVAALLANLTPRTSRAEDELATWKLDPKLSAFAISADAALVATGTHSGKVVLRNLADGSVVKEISAAGPRVEAVAFSPNGRLLASATAKTVQVWNIESGEAAQSLGPKSGFTHALAYGREGLDLYAIGSKQAIYRWDLDSEAGSGLLEGTVLDGKAIVRFPDSSIRIAGLCDGTIVVFEVRDGTPRLIARAPHSGWDVKCLALSADGKQMAVGAAAGAYGSHSQPAANDIHVWDLNSAEVLPVPKNASVFVLTGQPPRPKIPTWAYSLRGHAGPIWSVAFSPDGERLVSGSGSLSSFSFSVSSAGSKKVSADARKVEENSIKVWDIPQRSEIATFGPYPATVKFVSILADGVTIVSIDSERTVRLRKMPKRIQLNPIRTGG